MGYYQQIFNIVQYIWKRLIRAEGDGGGHGPPTFLHTKKKKGRQRQKRKGFKVETIKRLSLRSKYYCFSHSRASAIRKFFLSTTGQLWWLTVLFSECPSSPALPSPAVLPHFEIHFAGPVYIYYKSAAFEDSYKVRSDTVVQNNCY